MAVDSWQPCYTRKTFQVRPYYPSRGVVRLAIAVFALSTHLFAQEPPSFRALVNYVQLNVRVLDAHGHFVQDLESENFTVLEDGTPQTIATFRFVDIPVNRRNGSAAGAALPAGVRPNQPTSADAGRQYLFLLDDLHLAWSRVQKVKSFVQRFIRNDLEPDDRATVVFTSDPRPNTFTNDRDLLLRAVNNVRGLGMGQQFGQHPTLAALAAMTDWLSSMPGHKVVLFVSESVGCTLMNPQPAAFGVITDEDLCQADLKRATQAAVRADTSIYAIDPIGLTAISATGADNANNRGGLRAIARGNLSSMLRSEPLRAIADDTGGFAVVNTNSFDEAFSRIVRENSTYYLLGYYSTNDRQDGKFRKNEVTVPSRDVKLIYRKGYTATRVP
jgi:VWFA-related protein